MARFIVGIADDEEEAIDELCRRYWVEDLVECKDCKHYDPTVHFCNNLETHNVYDDFSCTEGEYFPDVHT